MKYVLITQTGTVNVDRTLCVQVPDDVSVEDLDQSTLTKLADDAGIEWDGTFFDDAIPDDIDDQYEVIGWSGNLLDNYTMVVYDNGGQQ